MQSLVQGRAPCARGRGTDANAFWDLHGTHSAAARAAAALRPRGPHPSGGCRVPRAPRALQSASSQEVRHLSSPAPGARRETGGETGTGAPGQAGAQLSALPAAPGTRPAHLSPGREERGLERQVSQKFPGLRCHGGRHLKQETRRGRARLRADKGGEGREEGGGGPRGPSPSARTRPLPSSAGRGPRAAGCDRVRGASTWARFHGLCPACGRCCPTLRAPNTYSKFTLAFRSLVTSLCYPRMQLFLSKNGSRAPQSWGLNDTSEPTDKRMLIIAVSAQRTGPPG